MTAPVIPPSPTREDYAEQYAAALAANGDETIFDRGEPMGLFVAWLQDATRAEPNDPNAMALSTVDADGAPDSRMVLLKDVDARGFTFYSNRESAKGLALDAHPRAALL
ncbi:MAG: pyridoxamine 5'-phosphate oxidase family protein, partial [Pseudomonadota bacterium]|nr:pyridoxamine 5'-phosphate oxidase family protein [Pseudomonadota bacterium]